MDIKITKENGIDRFFDRTKETGKEENWSRRPISESVGNVPTFGINAVTTKDGNPYFFLFADIDTKELEKLREVLKVYKHRNLSVYFYETTKGWHVVSPTLLKIRKWVGLVNVLKTKLPDYSFDTIRYTKRQSDGQRLYFENWNSKFPESYDLHYQLRYKFQNGFDRILEHWTSTKLNWCTYNQLRIIKKRHY